MCAASAQREEALTAEKQVAFCTFHGFSGKSALGERVLERASAEGGLVDQDGPPVLTDSRLAPGVLDDRRAIEGLLRPD